MIKHEWRERTDAGEVRLLRAKHHAGKWTLQARLKSEPDWTTLDPPPVDDLEELREVIDAKYRRGRVPHELLRELDELIARHGG